MLVANIGFAFSESNLAGQVIVILLFVGSIFAWSIMLTKMRDLRRAAALGRRFCRSYREDENPLALHGEAEPFRGCPQFAIYSVVCDQLAAELEERGAAFDDYAEEGRAAGAAVTAADLKSARNIAERMMGDQAIRMEENMGFLATAVSTAPFLGLLGTVWGVMEAFSGMAISGTNTLANIAPGISGALLTTIVGLIVAIPSSIGHNLLSASIRRLSIEMENFVEELSADFDRCFGED